MILCVTRCIVTVFARVITPVFPFRLATDVMSNYLKPLTETVFFSACVAMGSPLRGGDVPVYV